MDETQLEEGWIKHVPGDPCPCEGNKDVDVIFNNGKGLVSGASAEFWAAWVNNWECKEPECGIIAWRPVGWEYKPEPKPLELTLTETQINAFINLLSAAEMAYREENSYWQDQDESEDNHRPDWLHQVDQALLGIETNFPDLNLDGEAGIWTKADY